VGNGRDIESLGDHIAGWDALCFRGSNLSTSHRLVPVSYREQWQKDELAHSAGTPVEARSKATIKMVFITTVQHRIRNAAPERHTHWPQPFYEFPAFWPYWIYFDLDAPPLY
jgi:hypothetical protein